MWWLILVGWQALVSIGEYSERKQVYVQARTYANSVGKPLLVVGTTNVPMDYPCGDVSLDADPFARGNRCVNTIVADVRNIPYPDGYFGAVFISHVLEHLATVEDVELAIHEASRVADKVFVVGPSRLNLYAWVLPDHLLWVWQEGDVLYAEQRQDRMSQLAGQ